MTDSEGYSVTAQYDAAGRLTRTTYPDSTYEANTYDKLDPHLVRDRLGRLTEYTYNANRQLAAVRDPLGRVTSFDRCMCGALDSIVDAAGRRTHWDRDVEGRIVTETRPDNATTQYQFEPATSRLKQMTDRKGQVTTYAYFKDDALQQKTYTNASVSTSSVSFTYDALFPRMATMVDGTGTTTYSYYAISTSQLGAGHLSAIDGPLTNDTISYTYDELGRIASRSISGVAQSLTYDALGRTTNVTNALGSFTYAYVGQSGRPATLTYPNGQVSTYSYFGHTGDDGLQTILHQRADTSTISRFDYSYDAVNNIASWTRQADAGGATAYQYAYDAADQILGATKQTTGGTPSILARYRYAYDAAGSRTSEQIDDAVVGATYNSANELVSTQPSGGIYLSGSLSEPASVTVAGQPAIVAPDNTFSKTVPLSAGTNTIAIAATDPSGNTSTKSYQVTASGSSTSLAYDANGNLTSDGTRTFTWDAEDRLTSVTVGTHTSTFSYDGLNRRVEISEAESGSSTSDTKFVWCGLAICDARDGTGTIVKRYFDEGVQDSGTPYFYTRDHLGSVRELTDSSNSVRARYDYDAWGRRTKVSGDKDADIGYTRHYQHTPSGLTMAPFRAYDASLGRWISEDPAGLIDTPNRFEYVRDNPLGLYDPSGEFPLAVVLAPAATLTMPAWVGPAVVAATVLTTVAVVAYYYHKNQDADDEDERGFNKKTEKRVKRNYPAETDSDDTLKDLEEAQRRRRSHIDNTGKSKQRADQGRNKPKC